MQVNFLAEDKINPLHEFVSISTWQSLVAILIFVGLVAGLWYLIRKTKIRFVYRILIGLGVGLVFGIVIQAINSFRYDNTNSSNSMINPVDKDKNPNPIYVLWVQELSIWVDMIKKIFMNAILMLTVPVVFLAIVRTVSKQSANKKSGQAAFITVVILLVNVAVAFLITFFIGMAIKIGNGFTVEGSGTRSGEAVKPIPQIIWDYVPSNFVDTFTKTAIIPVMVIATLIGYAVKKLSKRHAEDMDKVRAGFERWWTICMSMLMVVVKIMPYAVMAMITNAIITRPIGYLAKIGIVIGVAYLCLVVALCWHSLSLFCFGINPAKWWRFAIRPVIQGFTTQSSNATLPLTMETLRDQIKVKEDLVGIAAPLSTSMGLTACAGVQSGIIISFIMSSGVVPFDATNFFMALIVTIIASLGIAGVPGTAAVVTAGVLGGIGYGALYEPVYSIIGALDGLFDMGRTAVNVSGGVQATTIAAKLTGQLETNDLLLVKRRKKDQVVEQSEITPSEPDPEL
ncbi:dicarboxylate/amino acid:cation symporter [Spiroplasma sp. DGKH1]|uniref:dicarboxylate/amino acid:cation symporter n=1 Tax=Spiroplasma sp. DGKH1 TaxID=3050074 RepID=UPI0034C5B340